jgi:hypothetical protein
VGQAAFGSCASLTTVSLPAVTSVGDYALTDTTALTSVYIGTDAPAEATFVFGGSTPTIYVTDPTATGWGATWNGRPVVREAVATDALTVKAITSGTGAVNLTTASAVTVPNAAADAEALNRVTADGRYGYKQETQALTFDGAKSITVTAPHTVVNAAMSATATLTLNDPATATVPYTLDVVIVQDATGSRVLTLDGNVSTPGGVQPVLSAGASDVDVLRFVWTGATWRLVGATFDHVGL